MDYDLRVRNENSPFKVIFPYVDHLLTDNKVGVAVHSIPDLSLIKVNEKYLSLKSLPNDSIENIIGTQLKDRVSCFDGSEEEKIFKEVISTGNSYYVEEFEYERSTNEISYYDSTILLISIHGTPTYIIETISDVTERVLNRRIIEEQTKEIEKQKEFIRKQKDGLENIIKGLGDEIVIVDKCGKYVILSDLINNRINALGKNYQQVYKEMNFYNLDGTILSPEETCTARALKGEKVKNLNIKVVKDGKTRYIQNTGIPIFNKNNEVDFVIGITHDITEIVTQSKKIEEQKKELEAVIENISDSIFIFDSNGKYIRSNKSAREMFPPPYKCLDKIGDGYRQSEFYDINGNKMNLEDTATSRVTRGEKFKNMRMSIKHPHKTCQVDVCGTPIYNTEGEFTLGVICSRDMTDYFNHEELIRSRYELMNKMIDTFNLPVVRLSCTDFKIIDINKKAFDILKFFSNDIKSVSQLKEIRIEDLFKTFKTSEYYKYIDEVIKGKKIKYLNKKKHSINGNYVYWNVIFEPVLTVNGEISEILILIIDVTPEIEYNIVIEKALKLQGEFLVNISHELKTPLNVILSTAQLFNVYCTSGSLSDKKDIIIKYIDSIKQNSYRLSKIINNIVDLSKIEAGFFRLNLSNNNIVLVVEEIVMSVTDFADSKGLNLIFDTDIEENIIACDTEKIERIVLNLISNAIKFSDDGDEILVGVKNSNDFVYISVKDNGIGIKEKNFDMIFDRFMQVDKSLSRNTEGTGIGLSLVKSIVELHGGTISVKSVFGEGSTFTVKLPSITVLNENMLYNSKVSSGNQNIRVELSDVY